MTKLMVFPLFCLLPPELRLEIYRQIQLQNHQLSNPISCQRILKIAYSPSLGHYVSNIAPPITLSISHESREQALLSYTYLSIGEKGKGIFRNPQGKFTDSNQNLESHLSIPVCWEKDTLYISSLSPLLTTFQHTFLFHLSTTPSRRYIRSLAIDLRVWNELCENGFLGILAKIRNLREVLLVVEFGRCFEGELGWLEAPEWRGDLRWVAERAEGEVARVRKMVRGRGMGKWEEEGREKMREVGVRCVFLTRGGEQA